MIKHIIFDFGGVIYNIDFTRSFEAFEKLGFAEIRDYFSQHSASELFRRLEKGQIEPEEFYEALRKYTDQPVADDALKDAWNALLLSYRIPTLEYLEQLKSQYNLYLLSNTNIIHYRHFSQQLHALKERSLESYFTKTWLSHEIHLRKPDREIYEWVLSDAGIDASETAFIDDTSSNLPAAAALGIHTHLLLPRQRIEMLDFNNL